MVEEKKAQTGEVVSNNVEVNDGAKKAKTTKIILIVVVVVVGLAILCCGGSLILKKFALQKNSEFSSTALKSCTTTCKADTSMTTAQVDSCVATCEKTFGSSDSSSTDNTELSY